jgi:hypothetical protein
MFWNFFIIISIAFVVFSAVLGELSIKILISSAVTLLNGIIQLVIGWINVRGGLIQND